MKNFTKTLAMKKLIPILFLLTVLIFSCNKRKSDIDPALEGQFRIEFSDGQVIDQTKIEFYDFSSSLIYLKPGVSFIPDKNGGTFDVFANTEKVYSGVIHPMYVSYFPQNSFILSSPSFYGNDVINLGYLGSNDPRQDGRIVNELKKNSLYRAGLSCTISSITKHEAGKVILILQLKNNDAEGVYYLDPQKMGFSLFHYFTNGLTLNNNSGKSFLANIQAVQPSPWNGWKQEWLSLIRGNETKIITLIYDKFDSIPSGDYTARFQFPGLSNQVKREDLYQNGTRIWLGDIDISRAASFK
jgi:hypothetical protein